jgi:hypothetical protein
MKIDDALRLLSRFPRREVPPFWPDRVTARATTPRLRRPAPLVMWIYWIVLAAIGGPLVLTSWQRLAGVTVVAGLLWLAVIATPRRHRSSGAEG